MANKSNNDKKNGYFKVLHSKFDDYFESIRSDSLKANELVSANDPRVKQLLKLQSKKIFSIEEKVQNVLQLYSLELDELAVTREKVNLTDEIEDIVRDTKEAGSDKSTVIETQFASNIPDVNIHKPLFKKWFSWVILKLYREPAVSHIIVSTSYIDDKIEINIYPDRVIGSMKLTWKGFNWICASRYFHQEKGVIMPQDNQGLQIKLKPEESTTDDELDTTYSQAKMIIAKIRGGVDLPTLSPIATKIIGMAVDEKTTAKQIADVITLDPALTAKVLRVVNSPLYGFSKEITTLKQAVALLGMNAVRTMSLCITVVSSFSTLKKKGFDYNEYWQRSLASAIACKQTAKRLNLNIEEEAFIGGLTHNVGKLILAIHFPSTYGAMIKRHYTEDEDITLSELKAWRVDHAKIGYEVFTHWKMPKLLSQSILFHHEPEKLTTKNVKLEKLTKIIYLSDIVSLVLYGKNKEDHLRQLKIEYKKMVNLEEKDVDEIMSFVAGEVQNVAREFDMTIGKSADYSEIVHMANKKLEMINLDYEQMNRELLAAKNKAESLAKELQTANKRLEELATTDGLTKLYNHRFFFELLTKEFSNASRHKLALSLVIFDIDYFKQINDSFGHQEGDKILETIGKIFKKSLRLGDLAARYGGEEFALILPNTKLKDAMLVADRIRKFIEEHSFTNNIGKGDVTISGGVAILDKELTPDSNVLVELADKALYEAKKTGRNRVISGMKE